MLNKISLLWNGYCPESLLKGEQVRMRLNSFDFYESEKTGLQICLSGPIAVILKFRGKGKFRQTPSYGDENENGEYFCKQETDRPPFTNKVEPFTSAEELDAYIQTIL